MIYDSWVLQLQIRLKPFQLLEKEIERSLPKLIQNIDWGPLFTVEDFSRDLRNICMKFAMLTDVCLAEALSSLINPNEKNIMKINVIKTI